jgi:uncharacterized protein (TIGR02996 family)
VAQEDTLLRAVLDRPDDDPPRLAFADYMEEIGDPRAEFIRVEIAFSRVRDDRQHPEFVPLAETAHTLIDEHGTALAGPIAQLVDKHSFDRGFVELVELTAPRFLELAPRLFSLAPVRHLNLREARPVARDLFASPYLQSIRSLSLDNCGLADREMQELARSPNLIELRWLSVADNRIGMPGAEALAASSGAFPKLRFARFRGNLVEPNEKFAHDQGMIINQWLPDAGSELESRYGHLAWLHAGDPITISDVTPSRFAR